MGRIHVLEDAVINKIAAGEVVERPASVIKELVENSLDAGASQITVDVDQGGCSRITVRDNGCGIAAEDVTKAVVRHATSKIRSADDLVAIGTMGFRGEALASVASVSRLTLQTRQAGSKSGTMIKSDGGEQSTVDLWNGAEGTELTVSDLFFNVPARLRFLKSPAAEFGAIHELMQGLAIAHPKISFTLLHNGKTVLDVAAVDEGSRSPIDMLRERAKSVFPSLPIEELIPIQRVDTYGHVHGLVSPPGLEKGSAKWQFTFVNGRLVKDRVLRSAVIRGYHSHLLKGRYPIVFMNLTMDPTLVDVNVHPAKTEVRFQYGSDVQGVVAMAIRNQLRSGEWGQPAGEGSDSMAQPSESCSTPSAEVFSTRVSTQQEYTPQHFQHSVAPTSSLGTSRSPSPTAGYSATQQSWKSFPASESSREQSIFADLPGAITDVGVPWRELHFIGDFGKCFLLFSHGSRLLAVDQHAFHERVLYERLTKNTQLLAQSQKLLMPESVTLMCQDVDRIMNAKASLQQLGFEFESVGDDTIDVTGMPSLLLRADISKLFEEIAENLSNGSNVLEDRQHLHHLLSTMACHGAVRAGEELTDDDLRTLIIEAQDVDFVHNCPHGRRVFRWFTKGQVAAWFDR